MTQFVYQALRARQAEDQDVFVLAAAPKDVLAFADIERIGRRDDGELKGFQRHQIASHIREIRDYLGRKDALLPNAVIVAFTEGVTVREVTPGWAELTIDAYHGKPGFVVDGQQRLSALSGLDKPGFEVFVSVLICKDYNQLRQQFMLINNTRPLPKALIYELLPSVEGMPERFTQRKFAARIVDRLNFTRGSALFGEIRQHTCPGGVLSDTAVQRLVMNSTSDGALRRFMPYDDREDQAYNLVNEYFEAVREIFKGEWNGMTPRLSRLRHGAGIVAMGFVMDLLAVKENARTRQDFSEKLKLLKPVTSWTQGQWILEAGDTRPWNGIQNTPSDIDLLTRYLVRNMKFVLRHPESVSI